MKTLLATIFLLSIAQVASAQPRDWGWEPQGYRPHRFHQQPQCFTPPPYAPNRYVECLCGAYGCEWVVR